MAKSEEVITKCDDDISWDIAQEISISCEWNEPAIDRTINLFEEDNTIPFIARYRQEVTLGMTSEKLREVKEKYDELKTVRNKVVKILSSSKHKDKITPRMKQDLIVAKTITEIEHISAPLKSGSKRSLAERARELGLEDLANEICNRPHSANVEKVLKAVNTSKPGLESKEKVLKGIQHIVADRMSKDKKTLDTVRKVSGLEGQRFGNIVIEVSQAKKSDKGEHTNADVRKFSDYFDKNFNINQIRLYQVLAINRGESLKLLSVKFTLASYEKKNVIYVLQRNWLDKQRCKEFRELIEQSIEDSYKRLIEPMVLRQARIEVNKRAEKEAIETFALNLRRLLLTPPVKGKVVLGVDPGFSSGCKYAVTSPTGAVLDNGVAFLTTRKNIRSEEMKKIKDVIMRNRCDTVAIGNGTACRETEAFFSECISDGLFKPLDVQYCIVNESGASIYSASPEAEAELPKYDIHARGAISIARRLQDPLAELVKIDPKHIGVGLYQHDCHETRLKQTLDEIVMECVSFTGVDLNSSSATLLRKIAGLDSAVAERIVAHRVAQGPFTNRKQMLSIKGLGAKKFQQCAGFVRILPSTISKYNPSPSEQNSETVELVKAGNKRKAPTTKAKSAKKSKMADKSGGINELDRTAIHPETYDIADRLIKDAELLKSEIGHPDFIHCLNRYAHDHRNIVEQLAKRFSSTESTIQFILSSLKQPMTWDIREEYSKPIFRRQVMSLAELKTGQCLTGKVRNVVPFGLFVDIGVGQDGLVHNSNIPKDKLNGRTLGVGDGVEVEVKNVDIGAKRIGLKLLRVL